MPKQMLQADATITDLLNSLNKRRDYVHGVFTNMWKCKREYGSASVRIGVSGAGRSPNYRIEYERKVWSEPGVFAVY